MLGTETRTIPIRPTHPTWGLLATNALGLRRETPFVIEQNFEQLCALSARPTPTTSEMSSDAQYLFGKLTAVVNN